jgi:hypothetical protein
LRIDNEISNNFKTFNRIIERKESYLSLSLSSGFEKSVYEIQRDFRKKHFEFRWVKRKADFSIQRL